MTDPPATLSTMATTMTSKMTPPPAPPAVDAPIADTDIAMKDADIDVPSAPTPGLLSSSSSTPAQLAALLATALADVESLRAELAATRAKADRAERLLGTFRLALPSSDDSSSTQPSSSQENGDATQQPTLPAATLTLIASLDERAANAEAARDDASARLAVLSSAWSQLNSYLAVVEARAADARAGYERIVKEGGGRLVLVDVPTAGSGGSSSSSSIAQGWPSWISGAPAVYTPPYMEGSRYERDSREGGGRSQKHRGTFAFQLPPAPSAAGSSNPNGSGRGLVRPRESLDSYPYKKPRGEEYGGEYPNAQYPNPPTRQSSIPYPHPSHPNSHAHRERAGSGHRERSSSSASDDIDAILLAASANGSPRHHPSHAHPPPPAAAQGRSPEWGRGGPALPERTGSVSVVAAQVQGKKGKDLHAQPTQTSFAGAATYPAQPVPPAVAAQGSPAPPAAPAPTGPFPATNAANQRICRQCGLPGRYKEGKCVEKWGPGPLGPGTVCDRCRKKMKRVERRGTLEQQLQQQQAAAVAVAAPTSRAVHRSDTLPAPAPVLPAPHPITTTTTTSTYREQESSMRSSLASPPPPAVPAARGGGTGTHTPNAGSSGRVIKPRMAVTPPGLLPPLRTHSPSPMVGIVDADGELDVDAEAEEEADELLDGDDAEGEADAEAEVEGDPEMDLLEAVDAAEANSNGSTSMNGGKGRVKSEE